MQRRRVSSRETKSLAILFQAMLRKGPCKAKMYLDGV